MPRFVGGAGNDRCGWLKMLGMNESPPDLIEGQPFGTCYSTSSLGLLLSLLYTEEDGCEGGGGIYRGKTPHPASLPLLLIRRDAFFGTHKTKKATPAERPQWDFCSYIDAVASR